MTLTDEINDETIDKQKHFLSLLSLAFESVITKCLGEINDQLNPISVKGDKRKM